MVLISRTGLFEVASFVMAELPENVYYNFSAYRVLKSREAFVGHRGASKELHSSRIAFKSR
jgi:hypothetical protein